MPKRFFKCFERQVFAPGASSIRMLLLPFITIHYSIDFSKVLCSGEKSEGKISQKYTPIMGPFYAVTWLFKIKS